MKKIIIFSLIALMGFSLNSCGEEKTTEDTFSKTQEQKDEEFIEKVNEDMKVDIEDISEKIKNGDMTAEEAEKAMFNSMNSSEVVKNQLEKSKEEMPKTLKLIKANKECIKDADNKGDAEHCMKESNKLAKKLGLDDLVEDENEKLEWSSDIKKEMLADIDKGIEQMEKMIPCIEDAKDVTDMMKCGNFE